MPNVMGGMQMYMPQSIFQPTMSQQSPGQQNESQWLKVPQVPPMTMPWSMPSLQQPDLVRFTGGKSLQPYGPIVHQKRKLETPDVVDTRPTKQFITEEMAQHFQCLHISANATNEQQPLPSTSMVNNSQSLTKISLPSSLETQNHAQPRLIISEEVKRLQPEPILPSTLLSKLERPSMALVLWEPPLKHLRVSPVSRDPSEATGSSNGNNSNVMDSSSISNNNVNSNNNNEGIPNLNQTIGINITDPTLEPMDL